MNDINKKIPTIEQWSALAEKIDAGSVKTLTTDDYSLYGNGNQIQSWKLPDGEYILPNDVKFQSSSDSSYASAGNPKSISIRRSGTVISMITFSFATGAADASSILNANGRILRQYWLNPVNSSMSPSAITVYSSEATIERINRYVKNLAGAPTTSTAGTKGQLLEDTTNGNLYICTNSASPYAWKQIDKDEILTNAGAPTTSTAGTLGQLLTDTTNAKLYQLTAIDTTDPQNPSYTWSEVGGSSVNVVQTTGASTTDVMSQGASHALVYADWYRTDTPNPLWAQDSNRIRIGQGFGSRPESQGNYSVIIGTNGTAGGTHGVHIGSGGGTTNGDQALAFQSGKADGSNSVAFNGGQTSAQGVFQIGLNISALSTRGYNNSAYRLISGVYDGQSAHDAATVGQTIGTSETFTVSSWSALSDSDPYDYQATVSVATTIPANGTVELVNDQAALFATHGFAIGAVDATNNTVTIYSIGEPASSVSLNIKVRS